LPGGRALWGKQTEGPRRMLHGQHLLQAPAQHEPFLAGRTGKMRHKQRVGFPSLQF
jgi:hypothetical protein